LGEENEITSTKLQITNNKLQVPSTKFQISKDEDGSKFQIPYSKFYNMKGQIHQKVWVEISKSALLSNLKQIRALTKPSDVMAVVKSNAYGHGLLEVASIIRNKVEWFVVDSLTEAMELRTAGIKNSILIIGYIDPADVYLCAKHRFSFVVYNPYVIREIRKDKKAKKGAYHIHLKVETGTTRQGLSGDELVSLAKAASVVPSIEIEGIYTHYANVEDTIDPSYAMNQLSRFKDEIDALKAAGIHPKMAHTAASSATILYPETRFDTIRLGIALYGHWPSREVQIVANRESIQLDLKPALTWKTIIAQVKSVKKGTGISYGLTERVHRDSKIAVLPVGYWDGYDRKLSSAGLVLVRGHICKVIGRICMNMMMIDVTDVPGVRTNDEVILVGPGKNQTISTEDISAKAGTIQYEFLTRINPKTLRKIVK
jgi:alanine racemase